MSSTISTPPNKVPLIPRSAYRWMVAVLLCFALTFTWLLLNRNRATVSGRVTDLSGRPLANAMIKAKPLSWAGGGENEISPEDPREFSVFSDKDGRFLIEDLSGKRHGARWFRMGAVQAYEITARLPGFVPQRIGLEIIKFRFRNVDFVLSPASTLSGRLLDTTGAVLSNCCVRLILKNPSETGPYRRVDVVPEFQVSGTNAMIHFQEVPPGQYQLEAGIYPNQGFHVAQSPTNGLIVVQPGSRIGPQDFFFEAAADRGGINGWVVDAKTGEPIDKYSIKLVGFDFSGIGTPIYGRAREGGKYTGAFSFDGSLTWKQSAFRIEDISPGTATLEFAAQGYARTRRRLLIPSSQGTNMTVALQHEGILFGSATLLGKPCAYGYVNLRRVNDPSDRGVDVSTDGNGAYSFNGLSEGEYLLRACVWLPKQLISAQVTDVMHVRVEYGKKLQVDFNFGRPCGIQGIFSAPDKKLKWMVLVEDASPEGAALPADLRRRGTAWDIQRKGKYSIEGLAPGTYSVIAQCIDVRGASNTVQLQQDRRITLKTGETAKVDFRLQ